MLIALLGLTGALVYGAADFLGGLSARRISAVLTTAVTATAGLAVLLVTLPWLGGAWSASAIGWGALSGVTGALAISLLYACLAIGPMSILSPLTAVVSAIVPMTVGLLRGEAFSPIGYWALGLALLAVVLVGFVPEQGAVRPSLRGILMAVGSGAAIGMFMVLIDLTPEDSGIVPLLFNRGVNAAIMFAVVLLLWRIGARRVRGGSAGGVQEDAASAGPVDFTRRALRPSATTVRTGLLLAAAAGAVDAVANVFMLIGLRLGELSVMSVLVAMYPAGTVLLAALVLKERIAPVQWVGLALAITAAGLLALA
ncbi:EamA-like transporter family protein [Microterricola gilva]|uniref:EamA-like transporter family protein n=1 Tax=Microterricola gilva TaxID=393267 RepID=A0A4Q8AHX7_9MICO|nr:EamA family transporter [Microterricola gilva]RZU63958.1 EamA-like transporter family protein [Microterricola gilva]